MKARAGFSYNIRPFFFTILRKNSLNFSERSLSCAYIEIKQKHREGKTIHFSDLATKQLLLYTLYSMYSISSSCPTTLLAHSVITIYIDLRCGIKWTPRNTSLSPGGNRKTLGMLGVLPNEWPRRIRDGVYSICPCVCKLCWPGKGIPPYFTGFCSLS